MICRAKALQEVANQLASDKDLKHSDSYMFEGTIVASIILLALATEIALKTLQCQERDEVPDHTHDLLELFEGLSEKVQMRLEEELPVQLDPISIRLGAHEVCPDGAGIRKMLEFHRRSFEYSRYSYETMGGMFYTSAMNEVLTVIIETYYRNLVESIEHHPTLP